MNQKAHRFKKMLKFVNKTMCCVKRYGPVKQYVPEKKGGAHAIERPAL